MNTIITRCGESSQTSNLKSRVLSEIILIGLFIFVLPDLILEAKEIHVSIHGDDNNYGSLNYPLRTITKAASMAQPGDIVKVHAGTYREWIKPPRGGASPLQPIIFMAAEGETVCIKGSERITTWEKLKNGLWIIQLPVSFFGDYNPFQSKIKGAWLTYGINKYHCGSVFIDENPLTEMLTMDSTLLIPYSWYTETNNGMTQIWANFRDQNPNTALTEIAVRECIFFPEKTNINYITIDGFRIMHSAENWSPPSTHQKGAVGTNHGCGWVIQNCHISDAKCIGICLGFVTGFTDKYIDIDKFQNDLRPRIEDFVKNPEYIKDKKAFEVDLERRFQNSLKEMRESILPDTTTFGRHVVRNNEIRRCAQSGIAGDGGNKLSLIEGNRIENINYSKQFGGWETAGIKFHGAVDVIIRDNLINGVYGISGEAAFGIWLDWEAQGTRISGNVISNTDNNSLYMEVNHGPILVDNNVIIGGGVYEHSEGVIFIHNLFYGGEIIFATDEKRVTPYYKPHSMVVRGYKGIAMCDDRWYNNIFIGNGLENMFKAPGYVSDYNVFLEGAQKSIYDTNSFCDTSSVQFKWHFNNLLEISFKVTTPVVQFKCPLITSQLIGRNTLTGQGIEHHDGSPVIIDNDYFSIPRDVKGAVMPGPFSCLKEGENNLILWPKK